MKHCVHLSFPVSSISFPPAAIHDNNSSNSHRKYDKQWNGHEVHTGSTLYDENKQREIDEKFIVMKSELGVC